MAKNVVSPMNLQPGATWTFVHSDGKRTEYVYDHQMIGRMADPKDPTVGLDAMHSLLNPVTGKHAQVSEKWMREGPVPSGVAVAGFASHWLVGEKATMDEPVAHAA